MLRAQVRYEWMACGFREYPAKLPFCWLSPEGSHELTELMVPACDLPAKSDSRMAHYWKECRC